MKRSIFCTSALVAFVISSSAVHAWKNASFRDELLGIEPSGAESGGQQARSGTKQIANISVAVRLDVPQSWKVRDLPDPSSPYLLIDCVPSQPNSCWLMVKSTDVPKGKTITEADRRRWDARKHPRYQVSTRPVSSRDLQVAGYPAHEVIVQNENSPHGRTRTVYVLASDVGRLFEFSFSAAGGSQDRYAEFAPAIEAVLQSFSPFSRAHAELSEEAIPESLKASAKGAAAAAFQLKTSAFKPGGVIPRKFTCDGPDVSPTLFWSDPPAGTMSFALIADDPDAPAGTWVHWVVFDLPSGARLLPEAVAKQEAVQDGGRQGLNDFGRPGYGGPCPPRGKPHRYFFKIYALDKTLNLGPGATKNSVEQAMSGHVLAQAELIGRFGH